MKGIWISNIRTRSNLAWGATKPTMVGNRAPATICSPSKFYNRIVDDFKERQFLTIMGRLHLPHDHGIGTSCLFPLEMMRCHFLRSIEHVKVSFFTEIKKGKEHERVDEVVAMHW
jgi:hypothetical protein